MKARHRIIVWLAFALAAPNCWQRDAGAQESPKLHAQTLADAPRYGPEFDHLEYADPAAPKGGAVTFGAIGTFDSFNPFIVKGTAAGMPGLYETLTTSTDDDALSEYGLIAQSMQVAPDKSWIVFNLRPEARWHDGKPITADDVIFSFDALTQKGDPSYRYYYKDVAKVEKLGELAVKFSFSTSGNRELPVIIGQFPILPKHFWATRNFEEVLIEQPLGSGPYALDKFDLGRSYTMRRVADYWGKDLPIKRGLDNYDEVRIEYFRDPTVALEAFKSGTIDFRQENRAKDWATAYDIPAVAEGRIRKELVAHRNPSGMQGFVFNLRDPQFDDARVRQALILAFDFEWSNKTLFFGQYTRSRSYFQNSDMEAKGLPSPEELAILEPLRDQIPAEVFTAEYQPPTTDGSGNARANLEAAAKLLDAAGWSVSQGKRVKDGKELKFEILLDDPAFERISEPYAQNLKMIGVTAELRRVDDAQYEKRIEDFDFDMISTVIGQSLSPGNEQREFWSSAAADTKGSRNLIGIKNPAVDKLVDLIIQSPTRADLIVRCKALDRVLQWNYYLVPHWHLPAFRIAYWNKFGMPASRPSPLYGLGTSAWWVDPEKEKALQSGTQAGAADAAQAPPPAATNEAPAPGASSEAPQASAPVAAEPAKAGMSPLIYLLAGALAIAIFVFLHRRRG
jgi:microcin C transport system substrate-binding protein